MPALSSLKSNPMLRGLAGLYAATFLSGAWAMVIPTIPVLGQHFAVSAGAAAQVITAFAIGKFLGTVIAGVILDRMGTRVALVGRALGGRSCLVGGRGRALVIFDFTSGFGNGRGGQSLGDCPRNLGHRFGATPSARPGDQQLARHL